MSSRNTFVVVVIAGLWTSIFAFYLPEAAQPPPRLISFLVVPVAIGVLGATGLFGETLTKVLLSSAGTVFATLIVLVKLGAGTEAYGMAYVFLYAVAPIVPFLGSVAIVSLLLKRFTTASFRRKS